MMYLWNPYAMLEQPMSSIHAMKAVDE
jgi:hypothetical protein